MTKYSPQLQRVLDLAATAHEQYEQQAEIREAFLAATSCGVIIASCMDGRGRPTRHLGLPLGVATEFRKGGVHLSYASSGFRERLSSIVRERRDRPDIFFHVVHDSAEPTRACGYWKGKGGLQAAMEHGLFLAKRNTQAHQDELFTVILCHDTDTDAYSVLDRNVGQFVPITEMAERFGCMEAAVEYLFPDFPQSVNRDLSLVFTLHSAYLQTQIKIPPNGKNGHHIEDTIIVGERFAHIAECKAVFLIDEKCGGVSGQMEIAGRIMTESLLESRISLEGDNRLLLLTQIPWKTDTDSALNSRNRACAMVGAQDQAARLETIFRNTFPDLAPYLEVRSAVINERYELELC